MSDPNSPSTSSARDAWKAVDDAWQRANNEHRHAFSSGRCACGWTGDNFARHRSDMRRDAALGVTYTPLCPTCGGRGTLRRATAVLDGVPDQNPLPCPSCNGSGRSAPRLALIDVLVADGQLDAVTSYALADGTLVPAYIIDRIPSSKES